jgi:hypothetical protein
MTKNGKLSKRDMAALNKAWGILSRWTEVYEADVCEVEESDDDCCMDAEYEYLYDNAMTAVAGLCEFINNYWEA